jgi:Ca-activated chloride channel family protein
MPASVRVFVLAIALALILPGSATVRVQEQGLSVRITSPMGRTGVPGAVRIVAQIHHPAAAALGEVKFFVDQHLLGAVGHAPYAIDWVDENPFERCEITVEAVDALGNAARDRVVLEPFEVTEVSDVSSVLLEASVQDAKGRFVKAMPPSAFSVLEDGAPQTLDLVHQEAVGATFAVLVDSSASMSRRMDFVQRTAMTLSHYMTPRDRMIIAPFGLGLKATTGPTNDPATIAESVEAIEPQGGTAILDSLTQMSRALSTAEGRRAIVLITDGYDEHSSTTYEDALVAVKSGGATLYVVGIGGVAGISIKGERLLRHLAEQTGGRFFFPAREEQLSTVHDVLTEDVQNRYLITYTPQNQRADGKWRAVAVKTVDPTYVVRVRPGYFAPKPLPIKPAVEFTAFGSDGQYLDLTKDDLEVAEDGVPQTVESFQEAVQPVSIVLALDASGSMRRKEADVVDSARRFVDALRPEDSLGLVLFSDSSVFAHDLATNRENIHDAIQNYKATGGTALYDALSDSLLRLQKAPGRRVVVVMTDGRDENNPGTAPGSVHRFDDVVKYAKESGATIFAIGLGTNVDRERLQQLAEMSGGQALFPEDVTELDAQYRRVVENLRRRYLVGYTSTHMDRDGSWRKVEIRVKSARDATVRTAGGYFAPER